MAANQVDEHSRAQFVEQLQRILTAAGGASGLSERTGISIKTLDRWVDDGPPSVDYNGNLTQVDAVGSELISDYPSGAGGDKTLFELAIGRPREDFVPKRRASRRAQLIAVVAAVAAVTLITVGLWQWLNDSPDPKPAAAVTPSSSASSSQPEKDGAPGQDSDGRVTPGTLPPQPGLMIEVSAGKLGVPVFGDSKGAVAPGDVNTRIPYGTAVYVRCKRPNESGMTSVAWFYEIVDGEWDGLAAVSNGFQNGDEFGISGGHNVNQLIPSCE